MKYLRHTVTRRAMSAFQKKSRARRMADFVDRMGITGGERILDLGGAAKFWADCKHPLRITIVNLPGGRDEDSIPPQHDIELVEGDACDMPFVADQSFDIAFSNSVIEHVGATAQQEALASEVHRTAPAHWVQTPSIWFPMEAHTLMPFWWFYPEPVKARFMTGWREKLPAWTEMIEGTTVIPKAEMARMFPTSTILTERVAGWPKSYIAMRTADRVS